MFIKNTKDFTISNHEWNFIKKDVLNNSSFFGTKNDVNEFIFRVEYRNNIDNKSFYILEPLDIYFLNKGIEEVLNLFNYNIIDIQRYYKHNFKKIYKVIHNYEIWKDMKRLDVGLVFYI